MIRNIVRKKNIYFLSTQNNIISLNLQLKSHTVKYHSCVQSYFYELLR